MMQTVSLTEAYPITYIAYGNLDFATSKGYTIAYELRRTGNVRMNANYTLQFADGTGSGANSGANIARSCLLYTSPSPRDRTRSRMPSSA